MYCVVAFEHGRAVCEVATIGVGLGPLAASGFARQLRGEFPDAIVAILPFVTYTPMN